MVLFVLQRDEGMVVAYRSDSHDVQTLVRIILHFFYNQCFNSHYDTKAYSCVVDLCDASFFLQLQR